MKHGFGNALAFDLKSMDLVLIEQFVNILIDSNLVVYGESLGSPETILAHPATMAHRSLTDAQRYVLSIGPNLFRLSIGFEEPEDIIRVFDKALNSFNHK